MSTGRGESYVAEAAPSSAVRRSAHLQAPTAERIEAALATLRRALQPDAAHPPVRASTLTLLVLVSGAAAAATAREVVAHLAAVHPSRTIVITIGTTAAAGEGQPAPIAPEAPASRTALVALVETAAVPDSGAGRVLHEVVTLEAHSPAAQLLVAGLVPALILGELPAFTWAADAGALDALCAGQCQWLIEASDGVLVESSLSAGTDRLQRLLGLSDRVAGQALVADLTWMRLEPWRELAAQCFDPPSCRGWAFMVDEAEVLFEPSRGDAAARAGVLPPPPAGALLLGGWLHARLPSHPPIHYRAVASSGRAPGHVAGIRLQAHGPSGHARFTVEQQPDGTSATIRAAVPGLPEASRLVRLPTHDRAELLGMLLQRPYADPFYQEALKASLGQVVPAPHRASSG